MSPPHHSSYSPAETRWMSLSFTASTAGAGVLLPLPFCPFVPLQQMLTLHDRCSLLRLCCGGKTPFLFEQRSKQNFYLLTMITADRVWVRHDHTSVPLNPEKSNIVLVEVRFCSVCRRPQRTSALPWPIWWTLSAASALPAVGNNWQLLSENWTGMSSGAGLPFTPQNISAAPGVLSAAWFVTGAANGWVIFLRLKKTNMPYQTDSYTF